MTEPNEQPREADSVHTGLQGKHTDKLLTANFVLLCVGSLFFFFSFHILLSTLPTYVLRMGGDNTQVGLIIGAFAASSLICRLPIGWLLDQRSAIKGMIVTGTLLFLASSLLYDFARSVPALLAIRLLHGAGMGAYNTASSTLVAHITPAHRRGEAMGVFGMASNVSMGVGPAVGVILLKASSYHVLFLVSAASALLGVLLALPLREHRYEADTQPRKTSSRTFFSREAVFPSSIIFAACLTYGVMVSFMAIFTIQRGLGNAGLFFMVFAFSLAATRSFAGRISDKYGRGVIIAPGMAFLAVAMLTLSQTYTFTALAVAAAIYGIGFACVHSSLMALAVDRVELRDRGVAMGTFTAAWELGIALGSASFGYILQATNFGVMFIAAAGVAAIGGVGFVIGNSRSRTARGAADGSG